MTQYPLTKKEIEEAHERIFPFINRTPVMQSGTLDSYAGCKLYFKCENFQKVGAFKARGAVNAVFSLSKEERQKGVSTHSSGNHAQALAYAAGLSGIPAWIVMPETAPQVKKDAVKGYGGKIIECAPTLEARESTLDKVVAETGAHVVHPYNDPRIIAGQATAAVELMEEVNDLDAIITPVGGGGLLSGTVLSAHYFSTGVRVYAGEPKGADDAFRSLEKGEIVPSVGPNTIADGLLTSLGGLNFDIIMQGVESIITVSDEEIIAAMRWLWERMKIIVEPSGAVPLAAVLRRKEIFEGKKVGVIISGGNVGLEDFFDGIKRKDSL